MDKKIPNLPAGQMISTWRMSQEGLSLGNQILKEKNDLGEAIVRAVKYASYERLLVFCNSRKDEKRHECPGSL